MYCVNCGGPIPSTARFCGTCGSPIDQDRGEPASAGTSSQSPVTPATRGADKKLIAIIAGVVIGAAAIAALLLHSRAQQQGVPAAAAATSASQDTAPSAAAVTPAATIAGFDWSGLSPEELQAARAALDAAIAREEQSNAKNPGASQPPSAPSTP
jgi:hypothetical protein